MPPILIASAVIRGAVNVPVEDQWDAVPLIAKAVEGGLCFGDFWRQHNDHRPVLPRALMVALARATDWDTRYETGASFVIALAMFAVLTSLLVRTLAPPNPSLIPWLVCGMSLALFSLVQQENWLWGWQVTFFLSMLGTVMAIWALARWGPRWPGPLIALAASAAAVLSVANGLVILALVPVALFLDPRRQASRGAYRLRTGLTVVAAAVMVGLYFAGFRPPPPELSPLKSFARPWQYVLFALAYLGAPLGLWSRVAAVLWGALGLSLFCGSSLWLWLRFRARREAVLPWSLLGLDALGGALITSAGRGGWGIDYALSSRYTTVSVLYWVSVMVITALAVAEIRRCGIVPKKWARIATMLTAGFAVAAATSYLRSWMLSATEVTRRHESLSRAEECVRHFELAPDGCLALAYPDPNAVRERSRELERLALGPFAQRLRFPSLDELLIVTELPEAGAIEHLGRRSVLAGQTGRWDEIIVSGWAGDPLARRPARTVLVTLDGRVIGSTRTGLPREAVANAPDRETPRDSGWTFRFGEFRAGRGEHVIEAYTLQEGEKKAQKLEGSLRFTKDE